MQVIKKDGTEREAKSPTGQEVADFLLDVQQKIEARSKLPSYPSKVKPVFSLDNAACHKAAKSLLCKKHKGKFKQDSFLDLPPYSPDLHKVIEHVHGTICTKFKKLGRDQKHVFGTCTEYQDLMCKIFYDSKSSKRSVVQDTQSLYETMLEVVKVQGGYPPSIFR